MRKWWFSIFCFIVAILISIWSVVALFILDNWDYIMTMTLLGGLSPCLLLIIVGVANTPNKEKKDE